MDGPDRIPPHLDNVDKGIVAIMNPSSFKGVDIVIELPKSLPRVTFVVWKSWAVEKNKREQLEQIQNIEQDFWILIFSLANFVAP